MATHPPQEDATDDLSAALAALSERTDKPQPAYVPKSQPPPDVEAVLRTDPISANHSAPDTEPSVVASGPWPNEDASEDEALRTIPPSPRSFASTPRPTVPDGQPQEAKPSPPPAQFGESTEPTPGPVPVDDRTLIRVRPNPDAPYAVEVAAGPLVGQGQVVPVGRKPMVVGRVLGALKVDDPFVSEGHASFYIRNGEVVVADGGSPSGVFVEVGRRVALSEGDVFACGLQAFRFLGPTEVAMDPLAYGAPLPFKAYRLEHLLVGGRGGRVVLFRHSASIGKNQGSLQFPDDELLDDLHVELRAGPHGMALVTHSQRWPVFMRIPTGAEVVLGEGALVRIGTSTLRVIRS